jgi:hypothetical protein
VQRVGSMDDRPCPIRHLTPAESVHAYLVATECGCHSAVLNVPRRVCAAAHRARLTSYRTDPNVAEEDEDRDQPDTMLNATITACAPIENASTWRERQGGRRRVDHHNQQRIAHRSRDPERGQHRVGFVRIPGSRARVAELTATSRRPLGRERLAAVPDLTAEVVPRCA